MSQRIDSIAKGLVLVSGLFLCQKVFCQNIEAEVKGPRPVEKAILMLEPAYGMAITYDDTLTVHPSLLEDLTDALRNPSAEPTDTESQQRHLFQKSRAITFSYQRRSSLPSLNGDPQEFEQETRAAIRSALSSVLKGYAASGGPETFSVTEDAGGFHVFPINFLSESGELKTMAPILDTKITIVPKQRSRMELLEEICQAVTAGTGINVGVGTVSPNLMRTATSISGTDQPVRSLLTRLMAELKPTGVVVEANGTKKVFILPEGTDGPFSWSLLYGPGWGYALNIDHVVLKAE